MRLKLHKLIKPELEERGISQKDFAKMLDMQPSHVSEVLNGKRTLSAEIAFSLVAVPAS